LSPCVHLSNLIKQTKIQKEEKENREWL